MTPSPDHLRELLEKAAELPWSIGETMDRKIGIVGGGVWVIAVKSDALYNRKGEANANLIVAAVNSLPSLLEAATERERIVAFLRSEADACRHAQGATEKPTEKMYRMGQKDGLLLVALGIENGHHDHSKGTSE